VALDGIWLKRSWGGEVKNVAVLAAVGVDQEGVGETLSCMAYPWCPQPDHAVEVVGIRIGSARGDLFVDDAAKEYTRGDPLLACSHRTVAVSSPVDLLLAASSARHRASMLPWLIGSFLLATAWLKVLEPAESASVQSVYDIPYWLLIVGIQLEIAVGFLLVARVWTPWAWGAAVALFASFAGISLLRALAGLESCGCFGAIQVNPWVTFAIDVALIGALWLGRKRFFAEAEVKILPRTRGRFFAYFIVGASSLYILAANRPERLAASTPLLDDERLVILEPSKWISKPFPLGPYLEPKIDLSAGRWIVVLYHHDCPKCQAALPAYERLASEPGQSGVDGILAVEVPPFGPNQSVGGTALTQAQLSETREWFVQAPVEIELENGVVTDASLELPSIVHAAVEEPEEVSK
jgi:hypothetical protein